MQLVNITLQNFRGIKNLNVTFNPGVNLIIGNNGAGKTSLLNGIAVVLSTLPLFLSNTYLQINKNDIYVTAETTGDVTENLKYHIPVCLDYEVNIEAKIYKERLEKPTESGSVELKTFVLAQHVKQLAETNQPLPLLCYLNAGRGTVKYEEKKQMLIKKGKVERVDGYRGAFNETMNFNDIENWCFRMDLAEYQRKKEIREYKFFKTMVSSFIKFLQGNAREPKIYYSSAWGSLVYVEGGEETPFYNLSAGFQSALCMAMELSYRTSVLNPEFAEGIRDVEGIVLIDEIEMHLHPAWQWRILEALKNTFPKVQFIVATHSPIILSSAKDASLYLMKSVDEVISLASAFGYKISDILEDKQGTKDMPEEVASYYEKIENLIDAGDDKELQKLQESIWDKYGKDSHVSKMIDDFIIVNKWIGEE